MSAQSKTLGEDLVMENTGQSKSFREEVVEYQPNVKTWTCGRQSPE